MKKIVFAMDCITGAETYIRSDECSLVIADPPYNLGFYGTTRTKSKRPRFAPLVNDTLSFQDYQRFSFAWLRQAYRILKPGHPIYIFIDWRMYPYVSLWAQKVGFLIKNCIVWNKVHFGMGYHYRYQHEFILYGIKPSKKPARRPSSRAIPDIWSFKKVRSNALVHPSEKPVELFDQMIGESTRPGEMVVDMFLGSGPSFLSTHAANREMRGFEIDPIHIETLRTRLGTEVSFVEG